MKPLIDSGLLFIRLGTGLSFVVLHGGFKLLGGPPMWEGLGENMAIFGITFAPVVWGFMSAFAETFCAFFVAIGLLFRPAAALLTINMTVAVASHLAGGEGWDAAAHALHMGILFIGLIFTGPGAYSVDAYLKRRKKEAPPWDET